MKRFYKHWLLALLCISITTTVQAQDFTVSGKVTDGATGEGLVGTNIIVKGTTVGTISDIEGNYSLGVPGSAATLIFSSIGYLTQEVGVSASNNTINLTLAEDITNLEEVVVTGLASSIKRSNLANAVGTVSGDELMGTTKAQTVDNALYGKLTGATIKANGGAPGGGSAVQLRGISTISNGNSQPLYIIDGVYINNTSIQTGISAANGAGSGQSSRLQDDIANRLADINPNDIESIEVLKGSSAAAIYGTRANAGVIIITTKRGQAGDTKVSVTQDFGFNKAVNLVGFAPWDQQKIDDFFGGSQQRTDDLASGRNNDYENEIYGETGLISNTGITITGGNDKTNFFINGSMKREDGIIKNSGFDRYSIRANIDHDVTKSIKLSTSSNYIHTNTDRTFNGNQNGTGASFGYNLSFTPPYADLFPDENGVYPDNQYFSENPLALRDKATNNSKINRFIQAVNLGIDIFQTDQSFLKFSIQGGLDYLNSNTLVHLPEDLQFQKNANNPGDVFQGKSDQLNTNLQAFLIYNTNLNTINFNTQVGVSKLTEDREGIIVRGQGLLNGQTNANTATIQTIFLQNDLKVRDVGIIAQEEVNWEDKIIATLGVRFDKSSLNLDQNKFYAFPKASLAVNIANFDFWNVSSINQLKLRAAYGETGGLPTFGTTFTQLN
ncbi:MAG: SusC/RagA family TonB-linked outer membrane protein, partial [Cyclobacteriaceae bacterium]